MMTDRRRYTGTQALQLGWSLLVFVVIVVTQTLLDGPGVIPAPLLFVGCTVAWFVGLVVIGLVDRRHWNEMIESTAFQRRSGPDVADLERIVEGYTVTVRTSMPSILSQTHTTVATSLDGVDASFTVSVTHQSLADGDGLTTGNDTLDDRFVIRGREGNVARILSTDVQRALMALDTPGRCRITGDAVEYEVPFTRLTADELETITETVVVVAQRVEALAGTAEETAEQQASQPTE
jgi:hypothetical protein